MDFEAIETTARRQVLARSARAVERRLNAGTSDHAGPSLDCECGQAARYAGRRIKVVQSILGGYHFQDMILRTIVSTDTGRTQAGSGLLSLPALRQRISIRVTGSWGSRRPAFLRPPYA